MKANIYETELNIKYHIWWKTTIWHQITMWPSTTMWQQTTMWQWTTCTMWQLTIMTTDYNMTVQYTTMCQKNNLWWLTILDLPHSPTSSVLMLDTCLDRLLGDTSRSLQNNKGTLRSICFMHWSERVYYIYFLYEMFSCFMCDYNSI